MRKLTVFLRVFCISLLIMGSTAQQSKACDIINGSDFIYVHLGKNKYFFKFVLFHQCACPLGILPRFQMKCGTTTVNFSPPRISIRDITPVCSKEQKPCINNTGNGGWSQGGRYGIEEHIFQDTIDFDKSPYDVFLKNSCCEIELNVQQPWGLVGTTTSTTTYGGMCKINLCNIHKTKSKGNNSPTFTNIPITFMCCNIAFNFNNGAVDLLDGDSMSFELAEPLSSNITPVSWKSPWSRNYPLTPHCPPVVGKVDCTPNINAVPPRGFFFDSTNGDIVLTPTKCDESGPLCIKITEYRKDSNGVWRMLGFTRRDIFVTVLQCDKNNPPTIQATQKHWVCEGSTVKFRIKSKDVAMSPYQLIGDTTILTWDKTISGATFEIVDTTVREREADWSWTPPIGSYRPNSYNFTVTVRDDGCPSPGRSVKGFQIFVKKKAAAKRNYKIKKCGEFKFWATIDNTFVGSATYRWSIRDSNNKELRTSVRQMDSVFLPHGGKYFIVHTINNSGNCPTIYRDTVILPKPPQAVLAVKDSFACYGTTMVLIPKISHAQAPYKYRWSRPDVHLPADTNDRLSIPNFNRDSTIILRVTDADKCVFSDTVKILVKPLPVVNIGPDQVICTYEQATFDAGHADTMKYLWNTGDTTRVVVKHIDMNYWVAVRETVFNCIGYDTAKLTVNDTVVSMAGKDETICNGKSFKLSATHRPASIKPYFEWRDLQTNGILKTDTFHTITPNNTNGPSKPAMFFRYQLFTSINQNNHICVHKDTITIKVNSLPDVRWAQVPPRCFDYGDILLNNLVANNAPANLYRTSGNFRITSTPGNIPAGANPTGKSLIDSILPNRHLFKTQRLDNTKLTAAYNERITVWHRDTNGCENSASVNQTINGNPIIEFNPASFCQDRGNIRLDDIVKRGRRSISFNVSWTVKTHPNGVSPSNLLEDRSVDGNPDMYFLFGKPEEDFYKGRYVFEYCVENKLTQCRRCDTAAVVIKGEPELSFAPVPNQCINWDTLRLLDYVLVDKNPALPSQGKLTMEYRDFNKVADNIINNSQFLPSSGAGEWMAKFNTASAGCTRQDSFSFRVNALPTINISNAVRRYCSTDPIVDLNNELIDWAPKGGTFVWSGNFVTGSTYTPTSKILAVEEPDSILVSYKDPNGCENKDKIDLVIRSLPEIDITSTGPQTICNGATINLNATKEFSPSTLWSLGAGANGTFGATASLATSYLHGSQDLTTGNSWLRIATLPIPNEVCPMATDSIQLFVHPYPQVQIAQSLKQCVPVIADFRSIILNNIPASQLVYAWDFGNTQTSTDANPVGVHYPLNNRYNVSLVVTNTAANCATKVDSQNYIEAYPLPVADFTTDPTSTTIALPRFNMINNSTLDISNFSNGSMKYLWDFGTGQPTDTSTARNPMFSYGKDTATYPITLIVESNYGCKDTFVRRVFVGPDIIVFVPNVFTPDRSGPNTNETFIPVVLNYRNLEMQMYNRWGQKVYVTTDIKKGWNGKYNGVDVPEGVYVYYLKVYAFDGKEYEFKGTVHLLR